jgi:hypothetical protein
MAGRLARPRIQDDTPTPIQEPTMTTTALPTPALPTDDALDTTTRGRMRIAAFRAMRLYPGPVGELVCRELLSWAEFGHRLGGHGFVMRLTEAVLPSERDAA